MSFLWENVCPKMKNLELKYPILGKFGGVIEILTARNLHLSVKVLSENCNCLSAYVLIHNAANTGYYGCTKF